MASVVLIISTIAFNAFGITKMLIGNRYVNEFFPVDHDNNLSTVPLWREWAMVITDILLRIFVESIWNYIFILQIFEMIIMLYIIESQRDNSIEELYFQFNAENMDDSSTS